MPETQTTDAAPDAEFQAPADFGDVKDAPIRGPRSFGPSRLWNYSEEAKHIIVAFTGETDTRGLTAAIAIRVLIDLHRNYSDLIDAKIDRDEALDRAFGAMMETSERSDRRNIYRAKGLRWYAALSASERAELVDVYDQIRQEAEDSALISTALDGGAPKN